MSIEYGIRRARYVRKIVLYSMNRSLKNDVRTLTHHADYFADRVRCAHKIAENARESVNASARRNSSGKSVDGSKTRARPIRSGFNHHFRQ